ncbi:vitamin K epoxide reductase family protein [Prochlorococcus sp. MIT 1300]|uniref:vitamin K epoxide reductase family protein n=1 Tax=Prochlorococcus sp. MIT 1300 TaxID=3096218 RepID=UPI002A74F612|nr:vitamin K epoxide reductase family protein [Prochlorococcus sp. MIT 1300]
MGSSRLVSRRRQDPGLKWVRVAIAILSTIGVIDTGSITISKWGWLGALSCPGGSEGCDKVLNSPWGTIFNGSQFSIPLSLIGLISYFAVLSLAIFPLLPGLSENKNELSRKTWWGLFILSCGMTIFSLILLGLMIIKIEAFCFFCVLSGAISLSLLVLTIIGGNWEDPGDMIFKGIILSIAVLLGGLLWASTTETSAANDSIAFEQGVAPPITASSTANQIALAKHLKSIGAVQYSAYWCPHCHEQKELFGKEAASYLSIVECAVDGKNNQHALCEKKGITGYPSWEINNQIYSGTRSLDELAELSDYKGAKFF